MAALIQFNTVYYQVILGNQCKNDLRLVERARVTRSGSVYCSLGTGTLLLQESKLFAEHLVSIEPFQIVQERGVRGDLERVTPAIVLLRLVLVDGLRLDTRPGW